MSKKNIVMVIAAIIVAGAGIAAFAWRSGPASEPSPTVVVTFANGSYEPGEVSIRMGETVRFVNASTDEYMWPASNLHPTHELYPEFDPREPLGPGDSWSFTFEKKGMWGYHDHFKPNRRGTVNVAQ